MCTSRSTCQGWPCIGCHDQLERVAPHNSTSALLFPSAESMLAHWLPGAVVTRPLVSGGYSIVEVRDASLSTSEQVGRGL